MGPPRARQAKKSALVGVVVVALGLGFDTEVVVAAKIDFIVGRIVVFIDVEIEIVVIVIAAQIAIRLGVLLLLAFFLGKNRLLRLQHGFGRPFFAAFDAGDGIVLVKIVEAGATVRAGPLGAPFRFDPV